MSVPQLQRSKLHNWKQQSSWQRSPSSPHKNNSHKKKKQLVDVERSKRLLSEC